MNSNTIDTIEHLLSKYTILVFIKGSKENPACGFSNTVVQILNRLGVEYGTYDVLENNTIREGIKRYSNWPTIPQLYIKGEFIGGCDIILNMYKTKALQSIIERLINS
uniref:Glutaredoxin n=1 Tax=Scinaia undulata TaxID=1884664 RepID=A0A1G4NXH3_9FLOR|nr:Hypothetical protein ORF_26 [Scinaia undulata]SCW23335.1 Hypothetical protein ORF_26 [Scinaia undulata]